MTSPPLRGEHRTLDAALAAAAEQFADREAYVDQGGADRLTYGAWVRQADSLAAALHDRGVRPGDVVALLLPACTDYAVCFAALVRLGAITSGINPRLGPREMDAIAGAARPVLVIRDLDLPAGPALAALPVLDRADLAGLRTAGRTFAPAPREPGDLVSVVWTSGTTGLPKGACFDHGTLHAAVASAGVMAAPYDRRLMPTPLAHAGYMTKLWEQVAWGITIVLTPTPWTAASMLDLLVQERITMCGGAPTQYAKLLELPAIAQADLSAVRVAIMATAPAPPDLIEATTGALGCPVVVRYAMTECPSISGTDPAEPAEVLFRTVGRPQAGVEVALVDENGTVVPHGEVGRVRVRSPGAMRGYWQGAGAAPTGLDDGWVTSSDLARLDDDGHLVLVGRESEMYIRGGYNVHPQEVENILRLHPDVTAAAVVGIPAPVIGEIGVAFVVLAEGAT
ncbi:MAG: putative acyl-CoA synthetase, partial [Frankiales bacterium]|nr:putative acyl-CoA synthetase [Frankiales bacterium]